MGADGARDGRLLQRGARLKVLLDATPLPAERVGVAHYLLHLAGALSPLVDLHLLTKERDAAELSAFGTVHPAVMRTRPQRLMWEQTVLPMRVRQISPDIFHGIHYTLPPKLQCPSVVTFHDPTFYTHPELHERTKVAYFARMARRGVKRASRVIAISDYSRRGAVEHAGADPDRTDVVRHGVDHVTYTTDADPRDMKLLSRLGVRRPFVFWVAAIEPRKDVPTLIDAFSRFEGHTLVLAGKPAWGANAVEDAVRRSPSANRILRPGYISTEEKVALYRHADAFVYPSVAEGFGMQILEAMACGCPVVTTTGSAPEEIGGDAVVLVPPSDPDALAAGIAAALGGADALRARGPARARGYTWDATARGTLACYERATR